MKSKKQIITALVFLLIAGVAFFAVSRTTEKPYIFENAPIESITLFNSLIRIIITIPIIICGEATSATILCQMFR